MESKNEFKKIDNKKCTCYYFYDRTKIEDFDFGNILLDQKSYEIFWFMTFYKKLSLVQNHCVLVSIK